MLSPGTDRQPVIEALATLFGAYPGAQVSDAAAALKVRTYLQVLEDRPAWAVSAAAMQWLRGDVSTGRRETLDFPPSAARLRDLATSAMEPVYAEIAKLQLLGKAKVVALVSEQERARRAEAIRKILEVGKDAA